MFCAHCGAKNNDDSAFCEACGARLAGASAAAAAAAAAPEPSAAAEPQPPTQPQVPPPPPQPVPPPVYTAPAGAPPPPPVYAAPPQQPPAGYPPPTGYSVPPPKSNTGLMLGVGVAALVVVAAAGYWFFIRSSGGGNKFDPAKASDYAHGAMLSTADFPGTGWAITATDDFSTDDPANDPTLNGPSCNAVKSQMVIFRNSMSASQSAKAKTDYAQDGTDVTATINVSIQNDTKNSSSDLSKYQQSIQHGEMPKCLESAMTSSGADTAKVTKTTPTTSVPKGGVSTAYDLTFSAAGQSFTMHIEDYAWTYSNAIVAVSLTGSKDKLTSDMVTAAVSKEQALLEKVASGPFTTPVVPTTGPAKSPTTAANSSTSAAKSPTATGPTPNTALTTWGKNLCTAVGPFNGADDPLDAADNYSSSWTLDQMKTQFQKDEKTFSDLVGKTITSIQAIQAPSTASKVQDAFVTALRQIKAADDIAAVQVSQAKTISDFDNAISAAHTTYDTASATFITVLDAASADVQDVIVSCD